MTETVETNWVGNMVFESAIEEFKMTMDSDEQYGETHKGPRPKLILLGALAGCTGMDMMSILKKKQVIPDTFRISVTGELAETYPKSYKKIHIIYELKGKGYYNNADILAKTERALKLSQDTYCAISAMIRNSCEMTYELNLLDS
jgi:putative redox protein